jgi:hypothetical protein
MPTPCATLAAVGLLTELDTFLAEHHQGFQVSLGEHGAGQWIAVFYSGHGGHHEVTAAGTAQEPTRWRTVQRAAWETLDSRGWR